MEEFLSTPGGLIIAFIVIIALFTAVMTFIGTIFELIGLFFGAIYYGIIGFFKLIGYVLKKLNKFFNKH